MSDIFNDGGLFTTIEGHKQAAAKRKKDVGEKMDAWKQTPEANTPIPGNTLESQQRVFDEMLYNDNSGMLGGAGKQEAKENFPSEVKDVIDASPRFRKEMEDLSEGMYGDKKIWAGHEGPVDLEMLVHEFSPAEMNLLRGLFDKRTTLTQKSMQRTRPGQEKAQNAFFYEHFKNQVESMPETDIISKYNKEFSKHKNDEKLVARMQSKMGYGAKNIIDKLNWYFPHLTMNPEINPTVLGNKALQYRNLGNQAGSVFKEYIRQPEKDRAELKLFLSNAVNDAKALGIKKEEDIMNYVRQRMFETRPELLQNKTVLGLMETPEYQKQFIDGTVEVK